MIVVRMFLSTAISYEHAVVSRPLHPWPLQASGTIDNVKARIQDKKDLPSDHRCLIFEGTQLVYGCTSLASNIQKEYTLHLVLCFNGGMPIVVKMLMGKTTTPDVISHAWRHAHLRQTLTSRTLITDVNGESYPHLVLQISGDMPFSIKTLTDTTFTLDTETMDMIDTSKQLEDGRTLSDSLVSRMRRGMHLVVKTLTVKTITFAETMDMIDTSKQLENGRTLSNRLVSRMRGGRHIVVKTLTVKTITFAEILDMIDTPKQSEDGSTLPDRLLSRMRGGMHIFAEAGSADPAITFAIEASDWLDNVKAKIQNKIGKQMEDIARLQYSQSMASVVWAFAEAGLASPVIFDAFEEVQTRVRDFDSQSLANTVWALAKAGQAPPVLFDAIIGVAISCATDFNSQSLANIDWAIDKAGRASQVLFDAITEVAKSCWTYFNSQSLANTVWAYPKAGRASPVLFDANIGVATSCTTDFKSQALRT